MSVLTQNLNITLKLLHLSYFFDRNEQIIIFVFLADCTLKPIF